MMSDLSQCLSCTFIDTKKNRTPQYWYVCKTCTKPNYKGDYTTGCCAACAAVCHKDHELVMRYDQFYCDCGEGTLSTSCLLYKAPVPIKLPQEPSKEELRKLKYCQFKIKPGTSADELKTIMMNNQQSHFLVTSVPGHFLFFPWIDQTSENVVKAVNNITGSRARSSEIDPRGEGAKIFVWSNDRKEYINQGSYDTFICQDPTQPIEEQNQQPMKQPIQKPQGELPNEPSKEEVKNVKYCRYNINTGTSMDKIETTMKTHQQSHFLLSHDKKSLLFPWVDNTTEKVCNDVKEFCSSSSRICEIDPSGEGAELYVWSNSDGAYWSILLSGNI